MFTVHQRILAQSPVFARMTTSGFSESITKEIVLPEDDEDIFGHIIEFLYGNERDAYDFSPCDESEFVEKLADMFVLADKYNILNIQDGIIAKLEEAKSLEKNRMAFFITAHRITQNSQDTYGYFQSYFARKVVTHLKALTTEETRELLKLVESAGIFSRWMFEAQTSLYREDQQKWLEENKSIAVKSAAIEAALVKSQASLKHYQRKWSEEKECMVARTTATEADLREAHAKLSNVEANLSRFPTNGQSEFITPIQST